MHGLASVAIGLAGTFGWETLQTGLLSRGSVCLFMKGEWCRGSFRFLRPGELVLGVLVRWEGIEGVGSRPLEEAVIGMLEEEINFCLTLCADKVSPSWCLGDTRTDGMEMFLTWLGELLLSHGEVTG